MQWWQRKQITLWGETFILVIQSRFFVSIHGRSKGFPCGNLASIRQSEALDIVFSIIMCLNLVPQRWRHMSSFLCWHMLADAQAQSLSRFPYIKLCKSCIPATQVPFCHNPLFFRTGREHTALIYIAKRLFGSNCSLMLSFGCRPRSLHPKRMACKVGVCFQKFACVAHTSNGATFSTLITTLSLKR